MFVHPHHPGQLVLFVTDRCNCQCPMCFNAESVFAQHRAPDLSLDNIKAIAKSLLPLPQLLLSGGEPFLRTDIPDIVRLFHQHSGTIQVSIPTNATLPDRIENACLQMLQECPQTLFNINLSLDNIGEAHDRQRRFPGCYEKFCLTYDKLIALREGHHNLTVNIITVISEQNVQEAPEIINAIRKKFAPNYHALGILRNDARETESSSILNTLTSKMNVVESEKESFARLPVFGRIAPALSAVVKKKALLSRKNKTRCFKCLAGTRIIVITNDGRLMPCEPLWLEEETRKTTDPNTYCMADLAAYHFDVRKALKSDQARNVRKFVSQKQCWCTYACAIQNGILFSPPQYIVLALELMKTKSR